MPSSRLLPTAAVAVFWCLVAGTDPATAQIAWTETTINSLFDSARLAIAADIDGDGDLDVVGVAAADDDLAWWQNNGPGGAWTETLIDGGLDGAISVDVADLDGDGDLDVIAAGSGGNTVAWWANNGSGGGWSETSIDTISSPWTIRTGDIDGDGDLDVVGGAQANVVWWANNGSGGGWSETSIDTGFTGVRSVQVADIDGDGDLDVLGAANTIDDVSWWANNGSGGGWIETVIAGDFDGANSVYPADLDGDGDVDVVASAQNADDVTWFANNGSGGGWTETTIDASFDNPRAVFASDLDGDGDLDVLGAARDADDVTWWANDGSGGGWTETTVDGSFDGAHSVFAADIDGDGDQDIVAAAEFADQISWWQNSQRGRATSVGSETVVDASFDGARAVCWGDFDGDGDPDIVAAGSGADQIALWKNGGSGGSWTETTVDSAFDGVSVFCADVDGDGDLDILGAAFDDSDISWWDNTAGDGSSWTENAVDTAFGGAHGVFGADIDGDGDMDIVGAAFTDDDVVWWENTAGNGSSWTERSIDTDFNGARGLFVADVDSDGDLDVLATAFEADDISWWENTSGDGTSWTERAVDTEFDGAINVWAGDLDGDGDVDVAASGFFADDVAWWENTAGNGTSWTEDTIEGSFDGATGISMADIDDDGDLDVLGTAFLGDEMSWWENSAGDGSAWTEYSVDAALDGAYVALGVDMDRDGDHDLLGAAIVDDDVAWWANDTIIRNQGLVISGTAGTGNNTGWRLLAAPCSGQTRASLDDYLASLQDDEVRRYDESAGSGDARWLNTGSSDALAQGTGFAAYLYDDATQEVGAHFGIAFPDCADTAADVVVSGLDTDEEWFLAGNPYMQSFDLSSLSGTGFQTTYKLWNPTTGTYTNITEDAGSGDVLKVGQGFFVQRTTVGAGGTTVTFDDAGKTSGGTFVGKGSGTGAARMGLRLEVFDEAGAPLSNDESASILVAGDATLQWDRYESGTLRPLTDRWATVALIGERRGSPLALSLLSLPSSLAEPFQIPLRFDRQDLQGHARLSWNGVETLPEEWTLELHDEDTGFTQNLRRVPNYGFLWGDQPPRLSLTITPATATGTEDSFPFEFGLLQNFPNPFGDETTIRFSLPDSGPVRLVLFDLLGREIRVLASGLHAPGPHTVFVDGRLLPQGTYLYRLITPAGQLSRTLHLIR